MVKIPLKVRKAIKDGKPFSLATSTRKGKPNIVYVGYLKLIDDKTVLIADNYFKKTKKNMLENPQIAFAVLDEKAGSYQLKGRTEYVTKGKYYKEIREWCDKKHPRKAAVVVHIKEVYNGAKKIA
jgi:hypothetical protein